MLRKMLSLGALVVVALAFGVGSATAAGHGHSPAPTGPGLNSAHFSDDGFSDGRL